MTRKTLRQSDGASETWDDETGLYCRHGADGVEIDSRPLTDAEIASLNPTAPKLKELNDIVDQLVLDLLMGGLS